jgi:hypothetical protein
VTLVSIIFAVISSNFEKFQVISRAQACLHLESATERETTRLPHNLQLE